MNIKEIAYERRATKAFIAGKKIPQETLDYILETSNYAPSSIGLESTRFVVIRSDEVKAKVKEDFLFNGVKLEQASDIVLFVTKNAKGFKSDWTKEALKKTLTIKTGSADAGDQLSDNYVKYVEGQLNVHSGEHVVDQDQSLVSWGEKQAYTQMGYMMLAAEEQGVQSLPVEGYNYKDLAELLREEKIIDEGEMVSVSLFLGYRNTEAENEGIFGPMTRMSLEEKVKKY